MDRELMTEAEALYGLPAAEFTAARKARAKELKADQPELAAEVAKLPKPSAAAAAINRIARDDPSEVRALVQAGRALRSAQESAVAGKGGAAVANATAEHRAALDRVRREARRLDLSDAVLDRVTATLRAASVDPELQPLLERGLLESEVEPAGFGIDPALVAAAPKQSRPKPPRKPKPTGPSAAARAAVEKAEAGLAAAQREAADAEQAAERARKAVAAAERSLAAARRRK